MDQVSVGIPGCRVLAFVRGSKQPIGLAYADSKGRFTIPVLPGREYELSAREGRWGEGQRFSHRRVAGSQNIILEMFHSIIEIFP